MKQFILKEKPGSDRRVRLEGDDYHYLVRVRRLKPGSSVPARLPDGTAGTISVLSADGRILSAVFNPEAPDECAARAPVAGAAAAGADPAVPPIVLFQALPKSAKIDLVIRQAAEGGLCEVVVFVSAHSVARPETETAGRAARWRRIVKEARQQSGSAVETGVRFCPSFEAALSYWTALGKKYRKTLGLLLYQDPLEQGTFHDYLSSDPEFVALAAGPEGGFSTGEVAGFLRAGFRAVRMGDTVLRTETAALYGAAAARIILLEKAQWMPNRT
ncbi:MAG: RsmE family RNA methyltransferase [Treponema sp.]|nr:RsmE family RNA methyltransferase [Treponema sp.]